MKHTRVHISVTEMPQFRRLVDFMEEVEEFGRLGAYPQLLAMVERCRDDMARCNDEDE